MLTYQCLPADYDATAGVCTNPVWVDAPGLLPSLGVADALQIGMAIVLAWTIGFGFKVVRKFIYK